jgi:hypothetical protein
VIIECIKALGIIKNPDLDVFKNLNMVSIIKKDKNKVSNAHFLIQ